MTCQIRDSNLRPSKLNVSGIAIDAYGCAFNNPVLLFGQFTLMISQFGGIRLSDLLMFIISLRKNPEENNVSDF